MSSSQNSKSVAVAKSVSIPAGGVLTGKLPDAVVSMVGALSRSGKTELARRLQIDVAPARDLAADRLAELGALAGVLCDHGEFTARLSDRCDLPALQAEADRQAALRIRARGGNWSLDLGRNYRAHDPFAADSPRRRGKPAEPFVPVQFSRRRPRGQIRGALLVDEWRTVPPGRYDQLSPRDAPSSALLTGRYGSWETACRAADGLLEDGRYLGIGRPWVTRAPDRTLGGFTKHEVLEAIRRCAKSTLTHPSGYRYQHWSEAQRRRARRLGTSSPRLPSHSAIVRLFGGYATALTDARITDQLLAEERTRRAGLTIIELPSAPRACLAETPSSRLAAAGISPELVHALIHEGFRELPLPQAVDLARCLEGSVDWLAETTPNRGAAPGADVLGRLDVDAVRRVRTKAHVSDAAVRETLDLPIGPWKRIQTGRDTPTLGLVVELARTLGVAAQQLFATSQTCSTMDGKEVRQGP